MADLLKQTEASPAAYPELTSAIWEKHTGAAISDSKRAAIWSRIEAYIAHRFTSRQVVWVVEGPGPWSPPLTPATVSQVEVWNGANWSASSMPAGPLGYDLDPVTYRVTADVGAGPVPDTVASAATRLFEYGCYEASGAPNLWATEASKGADGETPEHSFKRPASWIAKALQNSGAADLLRPYRRA